MTILNESGIPDALSPLYGLYSLAERLQGTLLVVVGTCSEAYLARSLRDALGPFQSRGGSVHGSSHVAFAVIDPRSPPQQGVLAASVAKRAERTGAGFVALISGQSAALLGVDVSLEARLAGRKLGLPVRFVDLDSGPAREIRGPGRLSTDLEDLVLAQLVDLAPTGSSELVEIEEKNPKSRNLGGLLGRRNRPRRERRDHSRGRPVVLIGGEPEVRRELTLELERADVDVAGSIPSEAYGIGELPIIGDGTVVAPVDPYLSTATQRAVEKGARAVRTLMPVGVDGTARFVQDVAVAAGADRQAAATAELSRARTVWESLESLRGRIRGRRIFVNGDTGFEVPLARFLSDAGAVVLEVGIPRLDRQFLSEELSALNPGVDVVEAPEWDRQLERIDSARPDVVISGPGLYVPLVARGHLCRSSLDFLRVGAQGYEGARRILELFVRTFERAASLDALNL